MRLNNSSLLNLESRVAKYASALLHLLFPQVCFLCWRETPVTGERLCIDCMSDQPLTIDFDIPFNNVTKHFFGRVPIQHGAALYNFYQESMLTEMLHKLKYRGKKNIGIFLGDQMAKNILTIEAFHSIDAIIPIPLHEIKLRNRGYNQSALIAEGISDCLDIPVLNKAVIKVQNNESQTRKSRAQRLKNVEEVFQLADDRQIAGRNILLIDDVVTTGATIEACALEVLKGKPKGIFVACAAVAR